MIALAALTQVAILDWLVVLCSALHLRPVPIGTLTTCFTLRPVTQGIDGRLFYDYYGFV